MLTTRASFLIKFFESRNRHSPLSIRIYRFGDASANVEDDLCSFSRLARTWRALVSLTPVTHTHRARDRGRATDFPGRRLTCDARRCETWKSAIILLRASWSSSARSIRRSPLRNAAHRRVSSPVFLRAIRDAKITVCRIILVIRQVADAKTLGESTLWLSRGRKSDRNAVVSRTLSCYGHLRTFTETTERSSRYIRNERGSERIFIA